MYYQHFLPTKSKTQQLLGEKLALYQLKPGQGLVWQVNHTILTNAEPSNFPSEFSCYQFVLKPCPINWCYPLLIVICYDNQFSYSTSGSFPYYCWDLSPFLWSQPRSRLFLGKAVTVDDNSPIKVVPVKESQYLLGKKNKSLSVIHFPAQELLPEFCIKQPMKRQPNRQNRFAPPDPATDESCVKICVPGQHCHLLPLLTNPAP